jgi:rSAM/selenodomain-associated transferase 2
MINHKIKYSVVIPTFNEENYIATLLEELDNQRKKLLYNVEIIIVDGQSYDKTIEICGKFNTEILSSSRGRGVQLKRGSVSAKGNILIFLHADLLIPKEMFLYIDENFNPTSDIAVFRMNYVEEKLLYKMYSFFTRFDSIFSTFGDQGLVISKENYNKIGGFKDLPVMEDVEFFKRARKFGRIKKFKEYITASTRRFKERGIIGTQLLSSLLIIKYLMGIDPKKLYEIYYRENWDEEKSINHICKISGAGEG